MIRRVVRSLKAAWRRAACFASGHRMERPFKAEEYHDWEHYWLCSRCGESFGAYPSRPVTKPILLVGLGGGRVKKDDVPRGLKALVVPVVNPLYARAIYSPLYLPDRLGPVAFDQVTFVPTGVEIDGREIWCPEGRADLWRS